MVIELSSDQSSHKLGKLCDQILNHEFPKGVLIELIISVIQVFKKDINKGIANTCSRADDGSRNVCMLAGG